LAALGISKSSGSTTLPAWSVASRPATKTHLEVAFTRVICDARDLRVLARRRAERGGAENLDIGRADP
jgi:hypothetical protein